MARNRSRPPIPSDFPSLGEAADFWDSHDLTDYLDQTQEVEAQVEIGRRTFLTAIEPGLAKKVSAFAATQGIGAETLINVWLSEKLAAVGGK